MAPKKEKKSHKKKSSDKPGSKGKSKGEKLKDQQDPLVVFESPDVLKGVINEDGDGGGVGGDVDVSAKPEPVTVAPPPRPRPRPEAQNYNAELGNELVSFDVDGHPYIDVDRLIYQPKDEDKGVIGYQHKDNLHEYIPDFSFILLNLVSLVTSIYFIMMGFTTLNWKSSVAMFSIPNCSSVLHPAKIDDCANTSATATSQSTLEAFFYLPCTILLNSTKFMKTKYNFSEANTFPIFRTEIYNPEFFGLIVMVSEFFHLCNVVSGISACLKGFKPILIQHIVLDVIIILIELSVSIIMTVSGTCDKQDLAVVRMLMAHFVRWYGVTTKHPSRQSQKEKQLHSQVDSLQIGLSCCGLDGWGDYLPAGYPYWDRPLETVQLAGGEAVIPYSCCRRWWIRNIYCSQDAHLWARPTATREESNIFHERIVQDGCYFKLEKFCQTMVALYGKYGINFVIIHTVLVLLEGYAAFVLIKNIDKMFLIQKKIMKRKELMHEPGDSANDLEAGQKGNAWTRLPPPTEDEILTIKQRNDFNKFMAAMKYGRVGRWMEKAKQKVTEGQEEAEPEPQTATEKKAREKELLHQGRQKKDQDGHGPKPKKPDGEDKKGVGLQKTPKEDGANMTLLYESKHEAEHSEVEKDLSLLKPKRKKRLLKKSEPSPPPEEEEEERPRPKRRRRRRKKKKVGVRENWWKYF